MKIFTKAILDAKQILVRKELSVDGIEVLLYKVEDLESPNLAYTLHLCSDNFETVNLEAPFNLGEGKPLDLLDPRARSILEKILELSEKIPNFGTLTTHLVGGAQVSTQPYKNVSFQNKKEVLEACLEYINSLDPENKRIALENPPIADSSDEKCPGSFVFYPIGKISSDFRNRIRTFDIAHSGITMHMLKNLVQDGTNYHYPSEQFGNIPVYFGQEEEKVAELAKKSLTEAVCEELRVANVVNVHVCVNKGISDGHTLKDSSEIDLPKILEVLKGKDVVLIPEVRERETGDYISTPNQRDMINYLKQSF